MPERDPRCVHVFAESNPADLVAAWLTHKGYPAEAVSIPPTVTQDSTTHTLTTLPGEYQVWVAKLEDAQPAREILDDQRAGLQALREREAKRSQLTGTISAQCEECGQASEWPAAALGTIQDCPHCGKYMDVPDPDDNWDDVDFEAMSEESEPQPDEEKDR